MLKMAVATREGDLVEVGEYAPAGRSGRDTIPLKDSDFIPLPVGTSIALMEDRTPVGIGKKGKITEVGRVDEETVLPASAILPPGYTRTFMPAGNRRKNARTLPFFGYTAIAVDKGEIYCTAVETHRDIRWDATQYNSLELPGKIKRKIKSLPENRLLKHLRNCAENYKCWTAQNIFYERWEGGIPVSPSCNAQCAGCISKDRLESTPAPQERICFTPTVEEIADIAVVHLNTPGGIASFGQGCEGEPLMMADLIIDAIKEIRRRTSNGVINMNTNGSRPDKLDALFSAGLDTVRISLNSAVEDRYNRYFRPVSYRFEDVLKSFDTAGKMGKYLSINHLFLPGVNDREEEAEVFFDFLRKHPVNFIQIRNLNIDPDYYFSFMDQPRGRVMGVRKYLEELKRNFPRIRIGNFTPAPEEMQ